MPDRRWEDDERFTGARDASEFAAPVERLLETLGQEGWVAEDPGAHLLPHVEAAAAELGLTLTRSADIDGVLELDLDLRGWSARAMRATAYQLLAAIAEASTHVREIEPGAYEVVTGMLPGDGSFATHGHVIRIRATAGSGQLTDPDRSGE